MHYDRSDLMQLRTWTDEWLQDQILSVPGVAGSGIVGSQEIIAPASHVQLQRRGAWIRVPATAHASLIVVPLLLNALHRRHGRTLMTMRFQSKYSCSLEVMVFSPVSKHFHPSGGSIESGDQRVLVSAGDATFPAFFIEETNEDVKRCSAC